MEEGPQAASEGIKLVKEVSLFWQRLFVFHAVAIFHCTSQSSESASSMWRCNLTLMLYIMEADNSVTSTGETSGTWSG